VVDSARLGTAFCCRPDPCASRLAPANPVDAVVSHDSSVRGYSMQLEGEVLAPHDRRRDRRAASAFAARKSTPSPASAIRTASSPHLAKLGLRVLPHPFADHHAFSPRDLEFGDDLPVLMTEKDAVKLRHAARPEWWVLPVSAKLDPAFGDWLLGVSMNSGVDPKLL